jgi:hypothetical protein
MVALRFYGDEAEEVKWLANDSILIEKKKF